MHRISKTEAMDLEKKFAITIHRLRVYDGDEKLTQQEVADDAEISLRYYQDLERGAKNPTLKVIEKIAGVYGLKAWELLQHAENAD